MKHSNSPGANFTLNPLAWLAVCFAAGCLMAGLFGGFWPVYLIIALFGGLLTSIFKRQKIALGFLAVSFAAAGGLHFRITDQDLRGNRLKSLYDTGQINSGDPLEIEGVLSAEPEAAVGGIFLYLSAETLFYKGEKMDISGNVRFFAYFRDEQSAHEYAQRDLKYGSGIRVAGNLRREDNYLNPGVIPHRKILDQKDIDAVGTIKSPLLVEKLPKPGKFTPLAYVFKIRQRLLDEIRLNFNPETVGVLTAALLGNRYFLDKQTAGIFRAGGTFHVLVISGLHITFIGGLVLLLTGFLSKKRAWQFILTGAFIWIYALGVGAGVPVVRASLMLTVLLFSRVLYRRATLLNAFGLSILVLLIWRPGDVFDQSFQLTVTSVAAIVLLAFPVIEKLRAVGVWTPSVRRPFPPRVPLWLKSFSELIYWRGEVWEVELKRQIWSAGLFKEPYLPRLAKSIWQGILRYTFEGTVVSAAVQIWLLPLLIYYFHRLSFFSIALNLWVGINLALESFSALLAIGLAQISPDLLAGPFIKLTELLNWFLLAVPQILVENDLASTRIPIYAGNSGAVYLLYFLPLIFLTILLNKWSPFFPKAGFRFEGFKVSGILFLTLAGLILFHPFSPPDAVGRLRVDFLDVGQGDAALVTFPDGRTMLIDGGGRLNFKKIFLENGEPQIFEPDSQTIGERVVSEFLWEKGYGRIDYILATHADADHIQGLTDVAKNFRVEKAFFGRTPFENAEFAGLRSVLNKSGVALEKLGRGDNFEIGGVRLEILHPEKDDSNEAVSDNNSSLVIRLVFGNRRILLTGDIEAVAEQTLVRNSVLGADVVKVAHHGSRTSSSAEFIEKVRAGFAVIPVGRESPFGHPHAEIVKRWLDSGAKVMTTGARGTITVSTDGKDLRVESFVK